MNKMIWICVLSIFFSSTTGLAQQENQNLFFRWTGDKAPRCQKLVEVFLSELRSMATDRLIELEAIEEKNSRHQSIEMTCLLQEEALKLNDAAFGHDPLQMRYLAKAEGYDSIDWLAFQRRYLRADVPPAIEPNLAPVSETKEKPFPEEKAPVWKTGWFWGFIAAGVATGAYFLIKSSSRPSDVGIDIR